MAEDFLYFAYGSNLLTRRLTAPERAPSAVPLGIGFVEGHRLTFDKVSTDGSGKCDCEASGDPTDRVYGALYRVASADAGGLDRAEGLGRGYRKAEISITTAAGLLTAVAYFATQKDPALQPYDWYKAYVVQGAIEHALPPVYVEGLKCVPSKPDPDAGRQVREVLLSHD